MLVQSIDLQTQYVAYQAFNAEQRPCGGHLASMLPEDYEAFFKAARAAAQEFPDYRGWFQIGWFIPRLMAQLKREKRLVDAIEWAEWFLSADPEWRTRTSAGQYAEIRKRLAAYKNLVASGKT